MPTDNGRGVLNLIRMDSNDNVTMATVGNSMAGPPSPKKTWKDFSPPSSVLRCEEDSPTRERTVAENPNINHKTITTPLPIEDDVGGGGDDGGGREEGGGRGSLGVDHKIQIAEGPVIRMGMGAITSRRDAARTGHPESLPVKGQLSTWKDMSPPKERKKLSSLFSKDREQDSDSGSEEKNRNSIRTNPFHGESASSGTLHNMKRIKTNKIEQCPKKEQEVEHDEKEEQEVEQSEKEEEMVTAETVAVTTTWRDVSPSKLPERRRKRPESGYFSNDVHSEGGQESREEMDSSLSGSDSTRRDQSNSSGGVAGEEGVCFHSSDYFYEDEFSVQFDTNLRETPTASAGGEQTAHTSDDSLPLNGSYTKFRDSLLQTDLYLGPYESELSGSRTSMEISSSEREMMCSSDMLNFSKDPLFSPTPPLAPHPPAQTVSVDSLSQQGQGHEMISSRGSNDAGSGVNCCIRKDAYFLSFSGSQHHSTESDASCVSQASSHNGEGGGNQSDNSSEDQDGCDEGSSSFHFRNNDSNLDKDRGNDVAKGDDGDDDDEEKPPPSSRSHSHHSQSDPSPTPPASSSRTGVPVRNMLLSRYPGRICLEALQDFLLSRSSSSKSAGSSRHSCSSNCKLSPLCGTLLSSGDLFMSAGHRRGLRRSSNLTTWKQVKSLKQLGGRGERNLHERASSLPDLTADDVRSAVRRVERVVALDGEGEGGAGGVGVMSDGPLPSLPPPRSVESLAHSFHRKRHSAYLLELYQRMVQGSNPPSPNTMSLIDQVLFQEGFLMEHSKPHDDNSSDKTDQTNCPSCGAPKPRDLHLDLGQAQGHRDTQCGRSVSSATTLVSPQTITLWYGQKNFSSQFPPNTADCGVQASLSDEDSPSMHHRSMQTSPGSPGADILRVLHEIQAMETRKEKERGSSAQPAVEARKMRTSLEQPETRLSQEREVRLSQEKEIRISQEKEIRMSQERDVRMSQQERDRSNCLDQQEVECPVRDGRSHHRAERSNMTRAKSATECRSVGDSHAERFKAHMRRTVSLSPSRIGMNSFYTHNSLPDLSFLSPRQSVTSRSSSRDSGSSSGGMSLFDPVQIPIILTPVVDDRSCHSQRSSSTSSGCTCSKDRNSSLGNHCHRRRSPGRSGEVTASSGSLSSSSGIELGYVEPRSMSGLPQELEHLLFFPPHLESAYSQLGLSENLRCCGQASGAEKNGEGVGPRSEVGSSPSKRCMGGAKIERYTNEAYPCVAMATGRATTMLRRNSGGGGSYSSCLNAERLDALKEEKTPSPEPSSYCHFPPRDYTDHRCFGCHGNEDDYEDEDLSEESSGEMEEGKLLAYQRWLQERKPPLKSCLRKQHHRYNRDHKARSLSLDYPPSPMKSDTVGMAPEKPPRRQNRHSIACDGMMPVLVDDHAFDCHSLLAPPPLCPAYPPPHPPQLQDGVEKVVMRKKKTAAMVEKSSGGMGQVSVEGSVDENGRSKRVSFASEVSFHSPNYTPQGSPRRQSTGEGEITVMNMEEDVLTLHVRRNRQLASHSLDSGVSGDLRMAAPSPLPRVLAPVSAEYSATCPLLPELSPLEQKASVVRVVIQAAETLVQHFARARDPFDKVRLGSAQETPVVGSLIVTSLCPAIERVVRDGMKSCLTGLHIFGKVHLSPWRVTENSAEIGPYTHAIHDLVKQLKVRPNLLSHRQKFYAFLAGLLNLRLLDFWLGYISTKETLTSRFYDDGAILRLSGTLLERQYADMLLALQPLAVLPFQVDYDIVASYSLVDSAYMGESDIEPPSPSHKKQEVISTSPKIVIARAKSQAGKSANHRASWAGPSDSQENRAMDLSATWDWLKTTTLPKARSFMSDMGLMMGSGSITNTGAATTPTTITTTITTPAATTPTPSIPIPVSMVAPAGSLGTSPVVKTSRLSQDLASVGIVSVPQQSSAAHITPSNSTPALLTTAQSKATQQDGQEVGKPSRPESYPPAKSSSCHTGEEEMLSYEEMVSQPALPAVVMDHGNKRKPEISSARLKAEEILRRKGEMCEPSTTMRSQRASRRVDRGDRNDSSELERRLESSPLKTVELSSRSESSPVRIQDIPTSRQSGSPQCGVVTSPSRQSSSPSCGSASGSPSRVSGSPRGSPNRLSGSPGRGPLINPGSPKSTVSGMRERESGGDVVTVTISRRATKITMDFPEDEPAGESDIPSVNSPQKKEEWLYREGKTYSPFDPAPSTCPDVASVSPSPALTSDPAVTLAATSSTNCNPSTTRSRLSGLKRLSPKGTFNIISFFDRLLLPSEKASSPSSVPASKPKESTVSECDSEEQLSSVATATSSTTSSSAPSPTPPESLHTSSSNSSPRHASRIPTSQSRAAVNQRGSRIPKRQTSESPGKTNSSTITTTTTPETSPAGKGSKKSVNSSSSLTRKNVTSRTSPTPIPTRTSPTTPPQVDINANSPEYQQPNEGGGGEEMVVEHNPIIGQWGCSSSETGQSDVSGQSVSMEEDQSRVILQQRPVVVTSRLVGGAKIPSALYK